MTNALPVELDPAVIEQLGRELDEIYDSTIADLGERDERYIRRLIRTQRSLALGSRVVMLAGAALRPRGVFGRRPESPAVGSARRCSGSAPRASGWPRSSRTWRSATTSCMASGTG